MLSRHVSVARAAMNAPWDGARAARVLECAIEVRRKPQRRSFGWMFVLAVASFSAMLLGRRLSPPRDDPTDAGHDQNPAVVSTPADSLDAGKQRG